ncbi:type VII secretion protein EccB [Mycobacterium florentinum]|uniref:Type VII secretion protein EccB n=1 Tax=Mycobacterium florentinum TaxID=292462 RepID=A0A1X1TZ95_MYCFL|nr:type VII secretion protein EccB [Mycobacterium florentinum]MCV7409184.1 type VII secretion protein EccB [Mycobacterium florentinum]ORV49728.1 type VII secretion protein EccB [Mycobacterium florentinum]BBX78693.1 ESX-4 secretion system ATPase EccB4 [Mycobacterium florentinum]
MPHQPTTWAHVSGYRFLLRRLERALLSGDTGASGEPLRARPGPLTVGCVLAAITVAGCAFLGMLVPQARLDRAQIVMDKETGALYVRVGDTWHPVLNLASARLVAATDANPQPVAESELRRTKRGPLLGIPGAPQLLGPPLSGDDAIWTICDTDGGTATTVVVGPTGGPSVHRLTRDQALLVAPGPGPPAYLLYNGERAVVDLADTAVVRALRLEGHAPLVVSQALLNAVPEAPPITVPRIRGAGGKAAGLPDFPVGSVLRVTRGDGDEYYAVLSTGVQRVGQVAADLLRFSDSRGAANIIAVAPDVIRGAQIVDTLPVGTFPERAPGDRGMSGGTTVCASSGPAASGHPDAAFLTASGLPLPAGQASVPLSQADGRGPALDAVYLPPGRNAYVRGARTRYLVTDTGVRFAIHDDDAAHDLGLGIDAVPAPWPMLVVLPSGPELSRANASVARDVIAGPP